MKPHSNFVEPQFQRCALCASTSKLQVSHIIPKFVFSWLRETSATGYFRSSIAPNLRAQDGLKVRMLCKNCEQIFASWEKQFSEKCFTLLNGGDVRNVNYGPWMLKFATSISWRVLLYYVHSNLLTKFPEHIMEKVDNSLGEWSSFLLGKKPHPGRHEQHMLLVDVIQHTTIADTPPNIGRYLARTIDIDVSYQNQSMITYAKMGKFMLFGFIEMEDLRQWRETKLHVRHGTFGRHDVVLPDYICEFLENRALRVAKSQLQLSERQIGKIRASAEQNPERVAGSETARAIHHDDSLFGRR